MVFPKISIITPSYNQGEYIEETILSILNQKYPNLEYIIIDGASTDNTTEIINRYKSEISYWISEKDQGQSEAINKGFKIATGDIITWINSDDLLLEGALLKIALLFNKMDEKIGVIHGGTILFNKKGVIKEDYGYDNPTIERYISGMSFAQPSAFIRKKYFDLVQPLNVNLHYGMDYDLFSKLSLVSEFVKIKECLSKYRIHEKSKSVTLNHLFIEDWIKIYIEILNHFDQKDYLKIMETLITNSTNYKMNKFTFEPISSKINWDLSFYYFITYVLRSDYIHLNFKRAKALNKYLLANYKHLINNDSDLKVISMRLIYLPETLIRIFRAKTVN